MINSVSEMGAIYSCGDGCCLPLEPPLQYMCLPDHVSINKYLF